MSLDIDMITVAQKQRHVITAAVFMDQILFFSIEGDFRLHFQLLADVSAVRPFSVPSFQSNIIQLYAHDESLLVLSQSSFILYYPFRNALTRLYPSDRPSQSQPLLLHFDHFALGGTRFLSLFSVLLDSYFLSFYFIYDDQIYPLTPLQLSEPNITDHRIIAYQLTQDNFIDTFTILFARPKQALLSCVGRAVGRDKLNVSVRYEFNQINEQASFLARADAQFVGLSSETSGQQISTFYRFGLQSKADFMNEKSCKLAFNGPLAFF